jgi:hypothetical protein
LLVETEDVDNNEEWDDELAAFAWALALELEVDIWLLLFSFLKRINGFNASLHTDTADKRPVLPLTLPPMLLP